MIKALNNLALGGTLWFDFLLIGYLRVPVDSNKGNKHKFITLIELRLHIELLKLSYVLLRLGKCSGAMRRSE